MANQRGFLFEWLVCWHRAFFFPLYYGMGLEAFPVEDTWTWGLDDIPSEEQVQADVAYLEEPTTRMHTHLDALGNRIIHSHTNVHTDSSLPIVEDARPHWRRNGGP